MASPSSLIAAAAITSVSVFFLIFLFFLPKSSCSYWGGKDRRPWTSNPIPVGRFDFKCFFFVWKSRRDQSVPWWHNQMMMQSKLRIERRWRGPPVVPLLVGFFFQLESRDPSVGESLGRRLIDWSSFDFDRWISISVSLSRIDQQSTGTSRSLANRRADPALD